MSEFKIYFVGSDGEQATDSKTTLQQISEVQALDCALVDPENQEPLTWQALNDESEPRTLFQSILADRRKRIDEHILMASRPSFCVITVVDSRAVRLEFYEGHDELSLVYDVRASELKGKELPRYMESDPNAYDPAEFLEKALGIPRELSEPLLKKLHEED
jgi:hypothetical protein